MLPNQIGLTGDTKPPTFTDGVVARVDDPGLGMKLNWGWLKVERRRHDRYGPETHITIKLPWPRCVFYDLSWDTYAHARPAFFIAFGLIECAHTAWHSRGQIIPVDVVPFTVGESLAYDRMIRRGEKPYPPGPGPYTK